MLSMASELRSYIADAEERAQEDINRFASLIDAGHLNRIPSKTKEMCDLARRYRLAKQTADNHREVGKLTLDEEVEENQALLAYAQARRDFESSNGGWLEQ